MAYTIEALRYLRRTGAAAVEVRPEAQAVYNRASNGLRGAPCGPPGDAPAGTSMPNGHTTTLWPTFTSQFRRATRRFQPAEYLVHEPATIRPCGCSSR